MIFINDPVNKKKEKVNDEIQDDKIRPIRVRYDYEFESIWRIKCVEEITYSLIGESGGIIKIPYNPENHNLKIYNASGELLCYKLISSGEIAKWITIRFSPRFHHPIRSKFYDKSPPVTRPYCQIIKLEYTKDIDPTDINPLIIPLQRDVEISIYIKECDNYHFSLNGIFVEDYGETLAPSLVKMDKNIIEFTEKSIWIDNLFANSNTDFILLDLKHKLPPKTLFWLLVGAGTGIVSIVSIFLLRLVAPNSITEIAAVAAISIPIMTFIIGLIPPKDIGDIFKHYDVLYLGIIAIIFTLFLLYVLHIPF
jgi:hypothetical protein